MPWTGLTLYPERVIWPGLMISLVVLSVNYIGDGLRDALDPAYPRTVTLIMKALFYTGTMASEIRETDDPVGGGRRSCGRCLALRYLWFGYACLAWSRSAPRSADDPRS